MAPASVCFVASGGRATVLVVLGVCGVVVEGELEVLELLEVDDVGGGSSPPPVHAASTTDAATTTAANAPLRTCTTLPLRRQPPQGGLSAAAILRICPVSATALSTGPALITRASRIARNSCSSIT